MLEFYSLTIGRGTPWHFGTLDDALEAAREWSEDLRWTIQRWSPDGDDWTAETVAKS